MLIPHKKLCTSSDIITIILENMYDYDVLVIVIWELKTNFISVKKSLLQTIKPGKNKCVILFNT